MYHLNTEKGIKQQIILFQNLHENDIFLEALYEFVNNLLCTVYFLDLLQSGNITLLSILIIIYVLVKQCV